jgi:hypothetical protein
MWIGLVKDEADRTGDENEKLRSFGMALHGLQIDGLPPAND